MADASKLKPYILQDNGPRELTLRSLFLATVLTVVFGSAAGYLGLKIGYTFPASIPAAVMALAILRGLFKDSNILESNMVQTQASAGEALMGGVVYMIPALIFLNLSPSVAQIAVMALAGGLLGVFLLIPFRRHFVIDHHDTLPYPEGTACANILKLGERAAGQARHVFVGMGIGALFNLLSADGLRVFSGQIKLSSQKLWGLTVGMHLTPLMLGVGFLVGPTVGFTMLAGGLLRGVIIIPGLGLFSSQFQGGSLSVEEVEFYVRMIGAGAVATGGFLSIIRMAPEMFRSIKDSFFAVEKSIANSAQRRVDRNLPFAAVVAGLLVALALAVISLFIGVPAENGGVGLVTVVLCVLLVSVLGFFFVTLCARLVGFLGTSSYPLSGQTIGALLVTVLVLRMSGLSGTAGMATAIVIGAVICIAIAISADASQDLKTGALLGATPYRQQIGEIIGVLISALVAGLIVILFHESGELARLPAPQARMMASIVEGVMTDQFPWLFVGIGIFIALFAEVIGVSSIMLAVGIYLPVPLASAFVVGGVLRGVMDKRYPEDEDLERQGTLLSSGIIAGWAIMGVALVGLVALNEFQILELDLALRSLPLPALNLSFLLDLLVSLLLYAGVVYYFGKVLRLWGFSGK